MKLRPGVLLVGPALTAVALFIACSSSAPTSVSGSGGGTSSSIASSSAGGDGSDGGADADAAAVPTVCSTLGLTSRPFVATGFGLNRGDLSADFTVVLTDGTSWTLGERATGCDTYVFLPDRLTVSTSNTASIWEHDLAALVKASPANVHYFFVSQQSTDALAKTSTDAMAARIAALTAEDGGLSAADAARWQEHLHVVAGRAQTLGTWVGTTLVGWGQEGFAVDRRQRLRGVGFLADVTRQEANAPSGDWPFDSNLAYAANEAIYMNAQADQLDKLDAEGATVVPVFTGGVLSEEGFADVVMPSAQQMGGFDTLEVEVTMACPDPTAIEFNSCGAWDYLAQLYLDTPAADAGAPSGDAGAAMTETEIARFITSYHRETHWVEDITPTMALLPAGRTARLHYSYAPSWNTQPTAVTMSLRFSNKKKGYAPATLTPLGTGGTFNDQYNAGRVPVSVTVPSDTKHAEVWMIVTGHGSDSHGCGEFCNSQHHFTVNGAANTWTVAFAGAGTQSGCIAEQKNGMVPNQGGTWWYGRDGWCPGEQVTPHVWDVTSFVTPGSPATLTYEGLFNKAPPPADGSGNIVLTSYLVTYR